MAIEVSWYNDEKTILYIDYLNRWTLEEFHDMLQKSNRLTDGSRPFVVIGDFSKSSMIPNGLLSTGRRIEQITPSHRLMLILVQPNTLMQMLVRTVSKIYPKMVNNASIVGSLNEALEQAQAKLQTKEK